MENKQNKKSELIPFKAPSKEMLKYYSDLYERNQTKWIRRASLEVSHLGSEFVFEDKNMKLMGTIDSVLMLVKDSEENYYRLDCNTISEIVTGKR
jgi:hypothetical protein